MLVGAVGELHLDERGVSDDVRGGEDHAAAALGVATDDRAGAGASLRGLGLPGVDPVWLHKGHEELHDRLVLVQIEREVVLVDGRGGSDVLLLVLFVHLHDVHGGGGVAERVAATRAKGDGGDARRASRLGPTRDAAAETRGNRAETRAKAARGVADAVTVTIAAMTEECSSRLFDGPRRAAPGESARPRRGSAPLDAYPKRR